MIVLLAASLTQEFLVFEVLETGNGLRSQIERIRLMVKGYGTF